MRFVLAFQHPGESLFKADVSVHESLKEACEIASRELDQEVVPSLEEFDKEGRWLVSCDDIWCVIFQK